MPDMDLTPLLVDALGKRVDDPAATRLADALGKKRFKSGTPNNVYGVGSRKIGVEVGTAVTIDNRAFWPPRKDGRVWRTFVSHAHVYPSYRGSLPAGFDFGMDDFALRARFPRRVEGAIAAIRFDLPSPGEGLRARAELGKDGRPCFIHFRVDWEHPYITIFPDGKLEHSVEDGFFVAWVALHGMLREGRVSAEAINDLRERRVTPLDFFREALGGLFWECDLQPEFDPFCNAYSRNMMRPSDTSATIDAKHVFGETNFWGQWKEPRPPLNEDTWENYDRIAPVYAQRLGQWRRGEIRSTVYHPQSA